MRVLITGGSGFLGRQLARRLTTDGDDVLVLSRQPLDVPPPGRSALWSGVSDVKALRQALDRIDAVIHLAARVHVMRDRSDDALAAFREVNVIGTETVLREAIAAGVRTFVYFSSIKAAAERSTSPLDERIQPHPEDAYGISKREAELHVVQMASRASLPAVILRPPMVYGPEMKGNMLRLFRLVHSGIPLPFGSIENSRSMVFSSNATWAVSSLLRAPMSDVEIFHVTDAEAVSTPELIRRIGASLERPVRLLHCPPWLLGAAGRMGDLMNRVARFSLSSSEIQRLTGSLVLDSSKLRNAIGRPPHTLDDGLRQTARWFREVAAA
jgi:nucleoside-diphosphate-sugar epimerase